MSPARRKAKSAAKPARRSRPAAKPKAKARPSRKTAPKAKAAAGPPGKERRRCTAMDPFGDPCQSAPRPGSQHCTIHSYLDR